MPAKFFCRTGELAGTDFQIGDEDADIGRDASNKISVSGKAVSGRHARITFDPKLHSYFLEPLDDGGRTWLDGARLGRKVRLSRLHVITLGGKHDFIFQQVEAAATPADTHASIRRGVDVPDLGQEEGRPSQEGQPSASETILAKVKGLEMPSFQTESDEPLRSEPQAPSPTETMADVPQKVVLPSFDEAAQEEPSAAEPQAAEPPGKTVELVIALEEGPDRHVIREGESVIGRGADSDIQIADSSLSRRHAALRAEKGRFWLRDLGSVNHTFVDDQQIEGEVELAPGVKVRFGLVEATIEASE